MPNSSIVCSHWWSFAAWRAGRAVLVAFSRSGRCTVGIPVHDPAMAFPRPVWAHSYARRGTADLEQMLAAR